MFFTHKIFQCLVIFIVIVYLKFLVFGVGDYLNKTVLNFNIDVWCLNAQFRGPRKPALV